MFNLKNTQFLIGANFETSNLVRVTKSMTDNSIDNLFINSGGGTFGAALFAIHNLLNKDITTIGGPQVMSAALNVFLCGKKRVAFPDSVFMFHESFIVLDNKPVCEGEAQMRSELAKYTMDFDRRDSLNDFFSDLHSVNRFFAQFYSKRTNLTASGAYDLMYGRGTYMSAEEALYYGFVHEIVPVECLEVKV